jgi:hypothetical protein
MAVIIASTAIIGLQVLIVGQIYGSKMKPRVKGTFIYALVLSFMIGLSAIVSAFLWYMNQKPDAQSASIGFFASQLLISGVITYTFWIWQLLKLQHPRRIK